MSKTAAECIVVDAVNVNAQEKALTYGAEPFVDDASETLERGRTPAASSLRAMRGTTFRGAV